MHFLPEQLTGLPESSDRRGRVRRNPSAIAYLDVGEGNGGIVLNVSETGMAVAVAQALTDDEIPLLTFRLPQLDRTFQAGGEVIWRSASKKSAGVRFVNLEERDRSQIRNWIRAEIVEAELKAPVERESESGASVGASGATGAATLAAPKTVLVMPSRAARKAAIQQESEAERDEARAAEFDRMFPSEAELAHLVPVDDGVSSDEGSLLSAEDHDDVELAAEAFLASRESEPEEVVAEDATAEADASTVAAAENHDWREEWEQFHIEREKLEKMRSSETSWELPRPFSAPLPEPVPFSEVPVEAANVTAPVQTSEPALGAKENAGDATARKMPVGTDGSGLGWYPAPVGRTIPNAGPGISLSSAVADAATPAANSRLAANPPKTEKDALSIAALCMMLVLMCFILGYAIQPGSFRFSSLKWNSTPPDTPAAENARVRPASEQVPVTPSPVEAQPPVTNAPSRNAATEMEPAVTTPAASRKDVVVTAAPKANVTAPVATNPPAAANPAEGRAAGDANRAAAASRNATSSSGTITGTSVGSSVSTGAVSGATSTPPLAAEHLTESGATRPPAVGKAGDVTIDAPVPVSFFPVTAPAEGSPAKMMVLPEETILQTRDVLIRSHQFLFVPPLPGPESAHELERVHLGDRIAKTDPGFAPQSLEKFQGSSIHLRSTIGVDGKVEDVQAISGPTSLIPAAVSAVRQWRYKPTDIDGKPIAIEEDIVIELRPSHS